MKTIAPKKSPSNSNKAKQSPAERAQRALFRRLGRLLGDYTRAAHDSVHERHETWTKANAIAHALTTVYLAALSWETEAPQKLVTRMAWCPTTELPGVSMYAFVERESHEDAAAHAVSWRQEQERKAALAAKGGA
jgi:predicted methyltransferase